MTIYYHFGRPNGVCSYALEPLSFNARFPTVQYFECSLSGDGTFGIGFISRPIETDQFIGWTRQSLGYDSLGDIIGTEESGGEPVIKSWLFGGGDVVGAGCVDTCPFFTLNGRLIELAGVRMNPDMCYPAISLIGDSAKAKSNLGPVYLFNLRNLFTS